MSMAIQNDQSGYYSGRNSLESGGNGSRVVLDVENQRRAGGLPSPQISGVLPAPGGVERGESGHADRDSGGDHSKGAPLRRTVIRRIKTSDQPLLLSAAEATELVPRGEVSRVRANLRAIQLARFMEVQKRHATPAEKRLLAAYTGWGGTKEAFNELYGNLDPANWRYENEAAKRWRENWGDLYGELRRMLKAEEWKTAAESTLNAHYTSAEVAGLMWKMAEQIGFKGGNVLEPSAGAGIFLTVMPPQLARKSRVTAIEMDNLTGRILRQLHPEA